ncbi:uncharacterized protein MYCGRDRAFT_65466 [Zymoseptoria tritici IPO323]|uniref:Caib baif family enzyme n=1 Tax=Zymoseptoria tritici (strain CBS 115943 / IPO323) TaxID=336722 RepID=F9WZW5_ZYMTI|nr:uncharacterized protein MYCGRDRAFT_65466 [Zymoseptoria tritici IPO323]EGP91043.1 hypothetical protein MYCGRDRAFT_65466 [Zymoseptoria tritici IPO323]
MMGSVTGNAQGYSVPNEAQRIFEDGILNNPLVPALPQEIKDAGKLVSFSGNDQPTIPINWRFAESAAALTAFQASMLNVLRIRKFKDQCQLSKVEINTDHASLFFMSPFLTKVVEDGEPKTFPMSDTKTIESKYGIKNTDLHKANASIQRVLATNIYKTKDGRFYHTHGSMNPEPTQTALGAALEGAADDKYEDVAARFQELVGKLDSAELDTLMNDKYRQAGTIAYTSEEFWKTEHGKANAHVGLYELEKSETHAQPASWWPENDSMPSSPSRPLAGLKIVDLTRIIAAPTISRCLAEMGASVMRVTSPHVTDMSGLHQDLNWGKWNTSLHLKNEEDRLKLVELIKDADVVVEGYRPSVMEKYGLAREDIFKLVKDRGRGIIHVKENCYGWNGPWQGRSGWQQISDACCGVSLAYGKAMGLDEAVTPVFPNSDYCTGLIGATSVLHALIKRAEEGGSYGVNASLNYYSQWLIRSVGEYPTSIWREVWSRHGSPQFHNYHAMSYSIPVMLGLLHEYDEKVLFNPDFFEEKHSKALGLTFVQPKPVARFEAEVELKYNVGTRGNAVDQPYWPKDLSVEVVA